MPKVCGGTLLSFVDPVPIDTVFEKDDANLWLRIEKTAAYVVKMILTSVSTASSPTVQLAVMPTTACTGQSDLLDLRGVRKGDCKMFFFFAPTTEFGEQLKRAPAGRPRTMMSKPIGPHNINSSESGH